jgi:hypothetical protein
MVARVQAHIDGKRPAPAKEFVSFAPEFLDLPIRLSITPDTVAVRNAVRGELHDYIERNASPGITLYLSHNRAGYHGLSG